MRWQEEGMNSNEYKYLQNRLTGLLAKADYLSGNRKQAYKDGVLAAKSVLHEVFQERVFERCPSCGHTMLKRSIPNGLMLFCPKCGYVDDRGVI